MNERLTLVASARDRLVLESADGPVVVTFPEIEAQLPVDVGAELDVLYLLHEGDWISLRRPTDGGLVFEAGNPPVRCGIDSVETQFCVVRADDGFFCSIENGGGQSRGAVEFTADSGPVRLGAGDATELVIDDRLFRAEVFTAVVVEPTTGDGLTEFSQSILVALE